MGLSNEERMAGIFHSVANLIESADRITSGVGKSDRNKYKYKKEVDLAEDIKNNAWAKLLKGNSNSLYWIIGSENMGEGLKQINLLDSAIISHSDKDECLFDQSINDASRSEEEREILRDVKHFHDCVTKESAINDPSKGEIFIILRNLENILYRLNRYKDDISETLSGFEDYISNLRGQIFEIFRSDKEYGMAYMLEQIFKKIFDPYAGCGWSKVMKNDKKCLFSEWFVQNHINHNFRLLSDYYHSQNDFDDLVKTWKDIQFELEISQEKKFYACLKVLSTRFHSEHDHKKLIKLLKDNKISTKRISLLLSKIKNEKKKTEKMNQKKYSSRHCDLTKKYV